MFVRHQSFLKMFVFLQIKWSKLGLTWLKINVVIFKKKVGTFWCIQRQVTTALII